MNEKDASTSSNKWLNLPLGPTLNSLLLHCLIFSIFDWALASRNHHLSSSCQRLKKKRKKSASVTSTFLPAIVFQKTLLKVITCVLKCQHGFAFHIHRRYSWLNAEFSQVQKVLIYHCRPWLTSVHVLFSQNLQFWYQPMKVSDQVSQAHFMQSMPVNMTTDHWENKLQSHLLR